MYMFKAFIYSKLGDTLHHHTTFSFYGNNSMATLGDLCSAIEYWIKLEPIYVKHPRIVLRDDDDYNNDDDDDDYDDDDEKGNVDGDEKSRILVNKVPVEVRFDRWLQMPPGIDSITIQVPLLYENQTADPPCQVS